MPKSILAIPFVCNVLPIIWLCNAQLIVPQLDQDFYNSIAEFKNGYINMYPNVKFAGKISVENLQKNKDVQTKRSAAFFSAGLDAWCTLVRHIKEKPDLISLWGADIPCDNVAGWNVLKTAICKTAKLLGLNFISVKSTFRKFINESELDKQFFAILNDGFWHGMQHGIGLIAHAAPCNYLCGVNTQYIAASFSKEDGKITCASYPTIDNYVKFFNCSVIHDAFITRQEKIQTVVDFHKKTGQKVNLHVCWQSTTGTNCCKCEKCARTIIGIIAEGENPVEYGFEENRIDLKKIKKFILEELQFDQVSHAYWNQIKCAYIKNYNIYKKQNNFAKISWLKTFNFDQPQKNWCRKKKRILHFIKNAPKNALMAPIDLLYILYIKIYKTHLHNKLFK